MIDWAWIQRNLGMIAQLLGEHVVLAIVPVLAAIVISIPLGYLVFRTGRFANVLLALLGVVYAVPSLALFVVMPVILGTKILNPVNIVVALSIYTVALLARTVADGLRSVDPTVTQAATAMGYRRLPRLFAVELPMALPVIFAGLRVATVSNISLVSVGALIGVESLDLVIASHADADHIGGLEEVVRFYKPRFFLDNGIAHSTRTYFGLLEAVQAAGSQLVPPTDRRIGLGDASLQVIPPPGDERRGNNDNSVGVIVTYGDFDAALTGDAEQPEFSWWQQNVPDLLREVEVYKAAHHGSPNGDSPESMAAFSPEAVVISVGADNDYGHPSAEALALYKGVGADVYRTDQSGTVVVTASSSGEYAVNAEPSTPGDVPATAGV